MLGDIHVFAISTEPFPRLPDAAVREAEEVGAKPLESSVDSWWV